jgi:1-acyl-sn-glycerol-3-phosphate acyltransferase
VSTLSDIVRRRVDGSYVVDEWGFDPDFVALLSPLVEARWQISVDGAEHIPQEGAAVLVANRRFGMSEPFAVASAVWQATGRIVRVLGVPDIAPIGPVLRRMGAVQDRPDELAGVLRAGQLALVFLDRQLRMGARVGQIGRGALVPAVELGVPVVPVAVTGRELSRRWRVQVGAPVVARTASGSGPLAVAETIDAVRAEIQEIIDHRS